MNETVIVVEGLRKQFQLSHSGAASLKTMLLWWKERRMETLEVLKGISFTVSKGETVAVIGRNGAGKSTLLSLLARVYKPTSGNITVKGRIAPLLELGAGFHPDLTGVENVFFNGVILGLSRKEISSRLEKIIDFAEIRKHMDAPVRTYSSGMLARLGFAVAVHVDAEVLLVDEVLAVGDYEFERKCYQKIDEFRREGGSILLVSHNMESVRRVADRCLWLHQGEIAKEGSPDEVILEYESTSADQRLELAEP